MLTNGTRPSSCKMSNNQMLKSSERQKLSTSIRALQSPVAASLADGFLCDKNDERSRILIQTKRQKSKILVRLCYSNIAMSQSTGWKATKASKNKVRNVAVKKAKSCPTSLKIYQSKKKKFFFFYGNWLDPSSFFLPGVSSFPVTFFFAIMAIMHSLSQ